MGAKGVRRRGCSLEIFTQEKKVFAGPVTAVTAPGLDGYFGVLANHAPLVAALGDGRLTLRTGNVETLYHLSGGFLEVHKNHATILADTLKAE